MLGLTRSMKWWEEWQLRILVLGSQFIQFILLLSARPLRWTRCRSIIWLAYISGDALAIYALATLFSRQKLHKTDEGVKVSSLEVVWVPVLLIHLGGQYTISAYSLEDNELWRRHVMTLVTQVTVAMYSFYKWWFGDAKLLMAAILLFILGIIKFAEKPWALRRASFFNIQAFSSLSPQRKQGTIAMWWTWWTSNRVEYAEAMKNRREREECDSLQEYVQKASKVVQEEVRKIRQAVQDIEAANNQEEESDEDLMFSTNVEEAIKAVQDKETAHNQEEGSDEGLSAIGHTNYFVDVIAPFSVRLRELHSFMKLNPSQQLIRLKWYTTAKSLMMYTNMRTISTPLGQFLHLILFPCLALVSVMLFDLSRKDGYNVNDIRVTYILFSCTALLELIALSSVMQRRYSQKIGRCISAFMSPGWVYQYSLLSYYARRKKATFLMKLATFNILRELVNKSWYIGKVRAGPHIRRRVFHHVVCGWTKYIQGDAARYKRFNNLRGQLALRKHGQMTKIGWSVSMRFDESVLLWHIATDLCIHYPSKSPQNTQPNGETPKRLSRAISNYMIYLLLNQPELLIPGARPALFSIASDDIELLLENREATLDGEESIARAIIQATKTDGDTLIHRASELAEALMKLDETKRWHVIRAVWIEMLCYSVSRRRGYLQAKWMAEHADWLGLVWVLWVFLGMETWVERYHRFEHSEEDEAAGDGGGGAAAGSGGIRGEKGVHCVGESSSETHSRSRSI